MDFTGWQAALSDLSLGGMRFFESLDSTNDEAARWAEQGAPHLSLVAADAQTAGRGRAGRRWFTPGGAGLAFSVVLRFDPHQELAGRLAGISAWGGLAVCDALSRRCGLAAQIKWPNDVLVNQKKLAGVLAEADWQGQQLGAVILGIGVNVLAEAVPPTAELIYPATSVQEESGLAVDRLELLHDILAALLARQASLGTEAFFQDWENRLAFRGQDVQILAWNETIFGIVTGLSPDGALRLSGQDGQEIKIYSGDLRLRPLG